MDWNFHAYLLRGLSTWETSRPETSARSSMQQDVRRTDFAMEAIERDADRGQALVASTMNRATASGCDNIGTWLEGKVIARAFIAFAN